MHENWLEDIIFYANYSGRRAGSHVMFSHTIHTTKNDLCAQFVSTADTMLKLVYTTTTNTDEEIESLTLPNKR